MNEWVVAYSGGRDSHVLLHLLSQIRDESEIALSAVHVNHGLMSNANRWEEHCRLVCDNLNVPLRIISLQLELTPGESIENIARKARYQAFSEFLSADQTLLTAHHLEDQAETFLLQLLRGSGPKGLAAMPSIKPLGQGKLARPLLHISREEITCYAKQQQLMWVEDDSNADLRFRRNSIRAQILPQLERLQAGAALCIARSASHCAATEQLLAEYIQADLNTCLNPKNNTLQVKELIKRSKLKQNQIVRLWLNQNSIQLPSTKKLDEILLQILNAKSDANPKVVFGDAQIKRYQGAIYVLPLKIAYPAKLSWNLQKGKGIAAKKLNRAQVKVRFRRGGERCRIAGHKNSRPLKKILQEMAVPVWERKTIPLIYQEEELVGVGNLFVCEGWQVENELEEGWVIECSE